jgi:hypothetical protein
MGRTLILAATAILSASAGSGVAQELAEEQMRDRTPIERWTDEGLARLKGGWQDLTQAPSKGGARAAPSRGLGVLGTAPGGIISSPQTCPEAPGGGPDCTRAARMACVKDGFSSGFALDVASGQRCRASSKMRRATCETETWVTVSVCY